MVRIDRSSGGRPASDMGMPPRPIGNTSAPASVRFGGMSPPSPGALPRKQPSGVVEADRLRVDVVAQPLVDGMAQRARLRPLAVVARGHEPGVHEARLARRLAPLEWAG